MTDQWITDRFVESRKLPLDDVMSRVTKMMDDRIEKRNREAKARRRRADRELLAKFSTKHGYWHLIYWLSEPAPRRFLSISEAFGWCRQQVRVERHKFAIRHWSADSHKLSAVRRRQVFARYFSRFGKRIWTGA